MRKSQLRSMSKYIFYVLLILVACNVRGEDKKTTPQSPAIQKPVAPGVHPLAENLAKIGAFSCAERANQIANFLAGNNPVELVIQSPKDSVNNRLLMSTMLIKSNSNYITASIALAPNQVNGCGGSYRTIFYSPMTCNEATSAGFPNATFQKIGQTETKIAVINRALWVMASPAGKGCIFVKEEIIE